MIPETNYARSGRVDLAYKVLGDGPRDLVFAAPGPSHLEVLWELPEHVNAMQRLAQLGRVIMFDKRGSGLSDRPARRPSLEQRADDVIAVMDAAGSREAVLIGNMDAGATFLVTAARHPNRVAGVIAGEVVATPRSDSEHPWGWNPVAMAAFVAALKVGAWGRTIPFVMKRLAPEFAADERLMSWFKRYETMAATPSQAGRLTREMLDVDIRPYLPAVRAPVLLTHDVSFPFVHTDAISWLAAQLPDARLRIVSRGPMTAVVHDEVMDEIEDFLAGTRVGGHANRRVSTLLFTDIVQSTTHLARVGNQHWQWVLTTHHAAVRRALARHGGHEIDTAGDGFFATFDLPSVALRCAADAVTEAATAGVQIRAGVHAGEVEVHDTSVTGMAVHVAARVAGHADPGDVLVTDTVRALVAGTELSFEPVGERELKGMPGHWALHRLQLP